MTTRQVLANLKFYDNYRFFPYERKSGIKKLNKYIKELKEIMEAKNDSFETLTYLHKKSVEEDMKHCKDKIKEYEKLKKKLQKELKNGNRT